MVLYIKTIISFWSYLAQFFLDWEMFQTKAVRGVVNKFSDRIFRARTERSYHTSR